MYRAPRLGSQSARERVPDLRPSPPLGRERVQVGGPTGLPFYGHEIRISCGTMIPSGDRQRASGVPFPLTTPNRLPGIDVLRALAASAVVLAHVTKWSWGYHDA